MEAGQTKITGSTEDVGWMSSKNGRYSNSGSLATAKLVYPGGGNVDVCYIKKQTNKTDAKYRPSLGYLKSSYYSKSSCWLKCPRAFCPPEPWWAAAFQACLMGVTLAVVLRIPFFCPVLHPIFLFLVSAPHFTGGSFCSFLRKAHGK